MGEVMEVLKQMKHRGTEFKFRTNILDFTYSWMLVKCEE